MNLTKITDWISYQFDTNETDYYLDEIKTRIKESLDICTIEEITCLRERFVLGFIDGASYFDTDSDDGFCYGCWYGTIALCKGVTKERLYDTDALMDARYAKAFLTEYLELDTIDYESNPLEKLTNRIYWGNDPQNNHFSAWLVEQIDEYLKEKQENGKQ